MPTSRATRVTSAANDRSWSTIVLMASLSCRISPRTSTVILRDRSPPAMAVVTSAMFRTCAVRLLAIEFTLSVRSFHVPATPGTCACPPSLPSVPTSRATRVTSRAKTPSCAIIELTIMADRRNSPSSRRPSTSSRTVWERSPSATAAMARVTSVVGQIRSSTRALTVASISPHAWLGRPKDTRCRVLPSFPTALPSRSSSSAIRALLDTISLNASAILPLRPDHSTGSRTEKLPSRTCRSVRSSAGSTSELSTEPSSGVVTTRLRRFAIVIPPGGAWRGDRASPGLGL